MRPGLILVAVALFVLWQRSRAATSPGVLGVAVGEPMRSTAGDADGFVSNSFMRIENPGAAIAPAARTDPFFSLARPGSAID